MACSVPLFKAVRASITAKIDFGNCMYFSDSTGETSCAEQRNLKVLKNVDWNGFSLDPCPNSLRSKFYEAYKLDDEFRDVDVIMCSHPAANCELYMPFNKSVIVYATTRLEFGRFDEHVSWRKPYINSHSKQRWFDWVQNLKVLAGRKGNFVAANNVYDAKYIEYFTGIKPLYIPSWCGGDVNRMLEPHVYRPRRTEVLVVPYRLNLEYTREEIPVDGWPNQDSASPSRLPLDHPLFDNLWESLQKRTNVKFVFTTMQGAFPEGYKTSFELTQFPVVVFIPYQVSTMFFFELYRLSIPILVPSKRLLLEWIADHRMLWERVYGERMIHDSNFISPFLNPLSSHLPIFTFPCRTPTTSF